MSYRTNADVVNLIDPGYRDPNNSSKIIHDHYTKHTEDGEFYYPTAFTQAGRGDEYKKKFAGKLKNSKSGNSNIKLDLRFVDNLHKVAVLVEMKKDTDKWDMEQITEQLQNYVDQEKALTGYRIVAMLANQETDKVYVWYGNDLVIDNAHRKSLDHEIFPMSYYVDLYDGRKNNKEAVIKAVVKLNHKLQGYGIPAKFRSQFVATCLLCLKYNLDYEFCEAPVINAAMGGKIDSLFPAGLSNIEHLQKATAIKSVLSQQSIQGLTMNQYTDILNFIKDNILAYINDKTTMGQDLLNLFFTTFNKYVGKDDKNQAFTPDHWCHFLCKVGNVNRHSRVLDITAGSGSFLVRAETEAMDDCDTLLEREAVKGQIFGIEKYQNAYGLVCSNMALHGNATADIKFGSCFDYGEWIESKNVNVVLMNPPYNASPNDCNPKYAAKWAGLKEDPTKGLHFVEFVGEHVKTGRLVVLLPLQCAIGSNDELLACKRRILEKHTLDAVFTLPVDIFKPGANVQTCCMVFNLGVKHDKAPIKETFFGSFTDDGFEMRKNQGRVEKREGIWNEKESYWLNLYFNRKSVAGVSVTKQVTADDEWLAEAYMETDYSTLTDEKFERSITEYMTYLTKKSTATDSNGESTGKTMGEARTPEFSMIPLSSLFSFKRGTTVAKYERVDGNIPYVTSSFINNGVSDHIKTDRVFSGNVLSINVDGSVCEAFYQPEPFACNGAVSAAIPKFELTPLVGLYITTVIRQEKFRYSYGRKLNTNNLNKMTLRLPVKDGKLDVEYITAYMTGLIVKIKDKKRQELEERLKVLDRI